VGKIGRVLDCEIEIWRRFLSEQPEKRGRGRPSGGKSKVHIDMTFDMDVADFLRSMKSGVRSKFVEDYIKQHPQYVEWRSKKHEET
jgi:hypothetical protein